MCVFEFELSAPDYPGLFTLYAAGVAATRDGPPTPLGDVFALTEMMFTARATEPNETNCSDGIDSGVADCADTDCDQVDGCSFAVESACSDEFDNDGDGAPDCADTDCLGFEGCALAPELTCDDSRDNDGDGPVDCADPSGWTLDGCALGAVVEIIGPSGDGSNPLINILVNECKQES